MRAFKNYTLARKVDLHEGSVTDSGIEYLKDSKVLDLGLKNCPIDRLDNITKLPYLQALDLSGTKINDSAIQQITKLKMLRTLALDKCDGISEDGLHRLTSSNSLMALILPAKKYSPALINELYEKMPQCLIAPYKSSSKLEALAKIESKKDPATILEKQLAVAQSGNKDCCAVGVILGQLSMIRAGQGRLKDSRELLNRAVAHLERIGDNTMLVGALTAQANFAATEKNAKKALALTDKAEHLFVDTTLPSDKHILETLNAYTLIPIQFGAFDQAIEYCQTALTLLKQNPTLDQGQLPVFLEKLGWLYYLEHHLDQARPYLQRTIDILQSTKNKDPRTYLRAIIEYSHTLDLDHKTRKALYDEGIQGLEKLDLPEEFNLKEHYCDACSNMAVMLAGEQDHNGAVRYLRKGLEATSKFKHTDLSNRQTNYASALVNELRAAGRVAEANKEADKYGVKR